MNQTVPVTGATRNSQMITCRNLNLTAETPVCAPTTASSAKRQCRTGCDQLPRLYNPGLSMRCGDSTTLAGPSPLPPNPTRRRC